MSKGLPGVINVNRVSKRGEARLALFALRTIVRASLALVVH